MESVELLDTQQYDKIKGVIDTAGKRCRTRYWTQIRTGFDERMTQQSRNCVPTKWIVLMRLWTEVWQVES